MLYDATSYGGSAIGNPIPSNRIAPESPRLYAMERAAADAKRPRVGHDTEIAVTHRADEPFIAQAT
ncbi:hypothetical protein [Trinickia sp.]|uniref:hypothetical protein n=1 Tax=Trinickia sp. TaxID=2571163 RepID=UPI003F80F640